MSVANWDTDQLRELTSKELRAIETELIARADEHAGALADAAMAAMASMDGICRTEERSAMLRRTRARLEEVRVEMRRRKVA